LRWRGRKRSLGWIPLKGVDIKLIGNGIIKSYGQFYRFWQTRNIGLVKCGSFNQDAQGRWYINLVCEMPEIHLEKTGLEIGVDLGLKAAASYSDGGSFAGIKATAKHAERLAKSQRARKKRQAAKIHAKIRNTRKDAQHKESLKLITKYDLIAIGDVSSAKLMKTKMAKGVADNAWYAFKTMLEYKALRLGKAVKIVDERWSTITCSACLQRTGPRGLSGLAVREWTCSCGASHDRDTNAAINILNRCKALHPN
jgi:putative transposase